MNAGRIKTTLFVLLLILLLPPASAQHSRIDSLDRLIRQTTSDTAIISLNAQKILSFLEINLDSAILLGQRNLVAAQKVGYRMGEARTRIQLANAYCYKGDYEAAKENIQLSQEIFKQSDDFSGLSEAYSGFGMMYGMQSKHDSSILYYNKAIHLAQQIQNEKLLNLAYQNIGISYMMRSQHAQALDYFQKALRYYEKKNRVSSRAYITMNMSLVYTNMTDTARAEQWLLKSVELAKQAKLTNVLLYAYSNLANLYKGEKSYEFAMEAARLGEQMGDQGIQSASLAKAASALADQKKFAPAEKLARQAIQIADVSRQPLNISQANGILGNVLMKQKRYREAIPYLEKVFLSLKDGDIYDGFVSEHYADLSECYQHTGEMDKALSAFKQATVIADSIRNKENVRKATELTMNYEFEKKQQIQQAEQNRKNAENEARQTALLIGLGLTLVLAAVTFYAYRSKQKANRLLKRQKEQIEQTLSALQTAQTQLIHKEKMASLGELTAGIAHEIQNPLNFINNFAEVSVELVEELQEEIAGFAIDPEEKSTAMEILGDLSLNQAKIHHHGQRAEGIVRSMLQHSRASGGDKQPTNLNALAGEYLRLSYHGLRAKDKEFNARLVTHFDEQLEPTNVVPQDLGRVLLNLFNNAFYSVRQKQSQLQNGYQPTVEVSTHHQAGKVTIVVRDNGLGVPKQVQDKIFQPFFTTKPTGQGTGLGLSLCYDIIVKGHGGALRLDTQEGEYAEFVIDLPIGRS